MNRQIFILEIMLDQYFIPPKPVSRYFGNHKLTFYYTGKYRHLPLEA